MPKETAKDQGNEGQGSELNKLLGRDVAVQPKNKNVRWFGVAILVLFFGGFFAWSTLAPIESAAIAQGKVTVTGNRRTIQHLEGGIIQKIYVKDGSVVKKGQVLVGLEDKRASTALSLTMGEAYQLMAIEGRLKAERDNLKTVKFTKRLMIAAKKNTNLEEVVQAQESIFEANQDSFNGNVKIMKQQVSQLKEQIVGVHAQLTSNTEQFDLIQEEVVAVAHLEKRKLIEKPKLLELKRNAARLRGARGENVSRIAVLEQKIGEVDTKIITMTADRRKEILTRLRESQQKLADLLKKEVVERDVYERTRIRSPQNGSVVALKVHTVGGVIKAGEPLMDIVPEEQLVIEARINPMDIDVVHKGLVAKVQLVAFKTRNTPALMGTVESVSADAFNDQQTGQTYYQAKIILNKSEMNKLTKDQELYPGMPVSVMIITDNRTLFNYLFTPVRESFGRAFREQ
jgi:HlyD family type I secretion membrane fusion protein